MGDKRRIECLLHHKKPDSVSILDQEKEESDKRRRTRLDEKGRKGIMKKKGEGERRKRKKKERGHCSVEK